MAKMRRKKDDAHGVSLRGHIFGINDVAISADGLIAVSGADDEAIRIWDLNTNKCKASLGGHAGAVLGVALSSDGRVAVSGSDDGTVRVWDINSRSCREKIHNRYGMVHSVAISSKGDLVTAIAGERLLVWSLIDGKFDYISTGHKALARSVSMSSDGRFAITGSRDNTIRVWDLTLQKCISILMGHTGDILDVSLSAEGSIAISGADDNTIRVWDVHNCKCLAILEGHTDKVRGVSISSDGTSAVTGSFDGTIRIWDIKNSECRAILKVPRDAIYAVAISANGKVAISGGDAKIARIWDIAELRPTVIRSSPLYLTAKVVLVGDSGVGKSGLAHRLADGVFKETKSTHGQQFWVLDDLKYTRKDGTRCEAILWDLAGQKNYRLTHALFLDDADLALVLLNSLEDTEPFKGVEYWVRKLSLSANRDGRKCQALLVAPRCDVSELRFGQQQLVEFCKEFGIVPIATRTSAATGHGIQDLISRIRDSLPWDEMTPTLTTETFRRIKDYVIKLKSIKLRRKILTNWSSLRKLLEADDDTPFEDDEMKTAVGHLQRHGYVRVLRTSAGDERVLLKPELLNNLAASIVLKAVGNEKGLGAIDENRARNNDYEFRDLEGLRANESNILVDEAITLFVSKTLAFRERHGDTTFLILPELINQKKPLMSEDQADEGASYVMTGAVENVYAALVVLLGYTNVLTRTHQWQDRAEYSLDDGEICGFRKASDYDGGLELVLFFQKNMSNHNRQTFQGLFERFLFRREFVNIQRYDRVFCVKCAYGQSRDEVIKRTKSGKKFISCSECGIQNPLIVPGIELARANSVDTVVTQGQDDAAARTIFETTLTQLANLLRRSANFTTPTCFISYAWGNKDHEKWVERMAEDLQKAEIDVLLDRWHNAEIGSSIDRYLDKLSLVDSIIIVGTPLYLRKYRNSGDKGTVVAAEMDLIGKRLRGTEEQKNSIRPILIDGNDDESFPANISARVYADCRIAADYFSILFDVILSIHRLKFDDRSVKDLRVALRKGGQFSIR